jgi:hypothetical protein
MKTNKGDSLFYIFTEKENEQFLNKYFKFGVVTHSITDEAIKAWKKYYEKEHPVSIIRRLSKLNNGNPREIVPVAYFKCTSDIRDGKIIHSGESKSRALEKKWLNLLRKDSWRITKSEEWFIIDINYIQEVIKETIDKDSDMFEAHWYLSA